MATPPGSRHGCWMRPCVTLRKSIPGLQVRSNIFLQFFQEAERYLRAQFMIEFSNKWKMALSYISGGDFLDPEQV